MRHLHLWDGGRRIFDEDRDAKRPMNGAVTVTLPGPLPIAKGITISVGIVLPKGSASDLWIEFTSASVLLAD